MLQEISEYNSYKEKLNNYVKELQSRAGDNKLHELVDLRKIDFDTLKDSGVFWIGDATEMLLPRYLGDVDDFGVISPNNKKPIFHNRWVMPIYDTDGKALNLVGYSNTADERYVYGTSRYYRRRDTAYGLERLYNAYEDGWCILTEGITDTLMIKSLGYKNSFAMCGTHNSDFIMKQLNRCRYGVIKIPDRDKPGKIASSKWKCNRSVTVNTFIQFKDIADMCVEHRDIVKEYIDNCIEWIKLKEHRGCECEQQEVTMYI